MHRLTCGISFLLHSVNLILFTLLLVHLILCISPHHSHHLHSHHLSLPLPSTPDLKLIYFTNPFLHSLSNFFWSAFTDLEPVGPVWDGEGCRISPPRFLAEGRMKRPNQASFVLLYFVLFAFSGLSLLVLWHFFLQYFDTVGWVFWPVKLSPI